MSFPNFSAAVEFAISNIKFGLVRSVHVRAYKFVGNKVPERLVRRLQLKGAATAMSRKVAIDDEVLTRLADNLQMLVDQPPHELRETMRGRELELLGARSCCLARLRRLSEAESAYKKFLDKTSSRFFLALPAGLVKDVKRMYAACLADGLSPSNQSKWIMEICRLALITPPVVRVTGGDLEAGNWISFLDVLFLPRDVTQGIVLNDNLVEIKLMSHTAIKDPRAGTAQAILGAAADGYIGAGIGAIAGQMSARSKSEYAVICKLADGQKFMLVLPEWIYHRFTFIAESSSANAVEDTKKCPYCAEIIKREALLCKHCRSELN